MNFLFIENWIGSYSLLCPDLRSACGSRTVGAGVHAFAGPARSQQNLGRESPTSSKAFLLPV